MQDFSWRPEGERPPSWVRLLYPVLGIAVGVLIGTALTSAAWEWKQATTRTELAKVIGSPPPNVTALVTPPKKDRPLVVLNPAAVGTSPAPPPVTMKRASPDVAASPVGGPVEDVAASPVGGPVETEISFPRPLVSTETPADAPRDYRALRLQMLRGQ